MSNIGKSTWNKLEDGLPDFNGKIIIQYEEKNELKEKSCWYETGNRRFPEGFSLLPPYLIPKIVKWRRDDGI